MLITAGPWITKACPECAHVFRGGTWGGIDAHWNAHHSQIMPYEKAWPSSRQDGNRPQSRNAAAVGHRTRMIEMNEPV
jgi:hypothetical protein